MRRSRTTYFNINPNKIFTLLQIFKFSSLAIGNSPQKRRSTITRSYKESESEIQVGQGLLTTLIEKKRNNGSRTGWRTHATSEPEEADNSPGETPSYSVSRVGGNNCGQTNRICRIVLRISPFGVLLDVLETDSGW